MISRGDRFVSKAAFYGVSGALLLSASPLVASADESLIAAASMPAAVERTLPEGITVTGNTMRMAPIPDSVAMRATTAAPSTALPSISLTERPAMIIRNGTITMDPVADRSIRRSKPAALTRDDADEARPRARKPAAAGGSELNCLARAIYFEARGESVRGQQAVAQVVLARKRTPGRPKTICGVVYEGSQLSTGCQFSFTCDGIADTISNRSAWSRAKSIAARAIRGKLKQVARGATFYHANYVRPYWAASMVRVATIGSHIFYRP